MYRNWRKRGKMSLSMPGNLCWDSEVEIIMWNKAQKFSGQRKFQQAVIVSNYVYT